MDWIRTNKILQDRRTIGSDNLLKAERRHVDVKQHFADVLFRAFRVPLHSMGPDSSGRLWARFVPFDPSAAGRTELQRCRAGPDTVKWCTDTIRWPSPLLVVTILLPCCG